MSGDGVPTNLILRVRLQSLQRSLKGILQLQQALERQQEGLVELERLLGKNSPLRVAARTVSVQLQGWITSLYDAHDIPADPTLDPMKDQVIAAAPKVMSDLQRAEKILNSILRVEVTEQVLSGLVVPAESLAEKIEAEVARLAAAAAANDMAQSDTAAHAWKTVSEHRREISELFSEYVDFVGGLALRSGGFGRNVFELGDELVEDLAVASDVMWKSLTLPASRERAARTLADIIRLGFPEWTIWALPLAAYEFGYVAMEKGGWKVRPLRGVPAGSALHKTLLADVFAGYALGPAYPCAVLMLRLDPFAHGRRGTSSPDGVRAAVLLATLDVVDARSGKEAKEGPFSEVIARLRAEWDAATIQASKAAELLQADADPAATGFPEVPIREGSPTMPGEEGGIEDVDLSDIPKWVPLACAEVAQRGSRYDASRWEKRQDWPQRLARNDPELSTSPFKDHLNDVLNAAWVARVEDPDAAEVIEESANRIIQTLTGHGVGGNSTSRRAGGRRR